MKWAWKKAYITENVIRVYIEMSARTLNRTLFSMQHSPEAPEGDLISGFNCVCNSAMERPLRLYRNMSARAIEQTVEVSPGWNCTTVSRKQRSIDALAIA